MHMTPLGIAGVHAVKFGDWVNSRPDLKAALTAIHQNPGAALAPLPVPARPTVLLVCSGPAIAPQYLPLTLNVHGGTEFPSACVACQLMCGQKMPPTITFHSNFHSNKLLMRAAAFAAWAEKGTCVFRMMKEGAMLGLLAN
eukprot:1138848-Pelagomonas_calceolata.AAC.19